MAEAGAPYEAARARLALAEALLALGDRQGSTMEILAVRSVFERLGAQIDLERTTEAMARTGVLAQHPLFGYEALALLPSRGFCRTMAARQKGGGPACINSTRPPR